MSKDLEFFNSTNYFNAQFFQSSDKIFLLLNLQLQISPIIHYNLHSADSNITS